MKRARFSEEQIIGVLKEAEAGAKVSELYWRHGIRDAHPLGQLVGELANLVPADPQPNQIARKTVPARVSHAALPDRREILWRADA